MKKKIIIGIVAVLLIALIVTIMVLCNSPKTLQDGYLVWESDKGLVLGKKFDEGNIIIVKENVKKVAENGNYILVERVEKKDKNYYIIEVKENKYIDDLSKKEFEEELGKKKIEKVKWFNAKRYKK